MQASFVRCWKNEPRHKKRRPARVCAFSVISEYNLKNLNNIRKAANRLINQGNLELFIAGNIEQYVGSELYFCRSIGSQLVLKCGKFQNWYCSFFSFVRLCQRHLQNDARAWNSSATAKCTGVMFAFLFVKSISYGHQVQVLAGWTFPPCLFCVSVNYVIRVNAKKHILRVCPFLTY